jgi:adenosyl cobinamide kinase/adenosyl cobinamide phosphate guanylyltransferase
MASNIVLHAPAGAVPYAVELARSAGDDLGLVLTAIEFAHEKVSGGRVEEDRDYAGATFNTFDEPIFIGSAIAQLAGHADAVVVDALEDWCARLLRRFPDDPVELDAEVSSLTSVMKAAMSRLILVVREDVAAPGAPQALVKRVLGMLDPFTQCVVDVRGGKPNVVRGTLPG